MSTDESKRKTVCLKLAKNKIYLCKNPSNSKFVPTRDISFDLKHFKELTNRQQVEIIKSTESNLKGPKEVETEPQEETVLQKYIRGFDCSDDWDDNIQTSYPSSSRGDSYENGAQCLNLDYYQDGCTTDFKPIVNSVTSPQCRVEFVTPTDVGEASVCVKDDVKLLKPLIVDLSQKKVPSKDSLPLKILKTPRSDLKLLNRNFITPQVKVENFSTTSESSDLPLIISPAETPNFRDGSPSSTPYPSTKIEIDFTGSSIQESHVVERDYCRPVKSELQIDMSANMLYSRDVEFSGHNGLSEASYNLLNSLNQNQPMRMGTSQKDVMKAAKALYSKRTRTLFHWINPKIPKTKLKDSVMIAWDQLPSWQKQIYINQVIGKCGSDSVSPMVNPQILDMSGMAEAVLSASANEMEDQNTAPAPKKKRKYTRKSTAASATKTNNTSMSALDPGSSIYNFLASL